MTDERMLLLNAAIKSIDNVDDNVYSVRSALGQVYEHTRFDGMPFDEAQVRLQRARLHEFMDSLDKAIQLLDQTLI